METLRFKWFGLIEERIVSTADLINLKSAQQESYPIDLFNLTV